MDVTGFGIERVYVRFFIHLSSKYVHLTVLIFFWFAPTSLLPASYLYISGSKSLIMCRYDNEPFTLRVLRGTTALQDHEVALTELCSNPDTTSTEAEQCMIDYIQGGYATIPDQKSLGTSSKQINVDRIPDDGECLLEPNNDDDDSECLLNDIHSLWASDLPMSSLQQQQQQGSMTRNDNSNTNAVPVKPWSSRASPSGTFVRDPITGKMKNLDSTN